MLRIKELIKNTFIIAIGKFSTQIVSFFLLPLYTAKLTANEYGNYDLVVTISVFLVPLITMMLEESMFRFLIDAKTKEQKKQIITNSFVFSILNSIVLTTIILLIGKMCSNVIFFYIVIYSIGSMFMALANALARGEGQIILFSVSNFILSVFTIALSILFILYLKLGFKSLILSACISNIIISSIILLKLNILKYLSLKLFNFSTLKKMLKYSIPLVPNAICWEIINVSDRLFIINVIGSSANGIYSIANKFPNIVNNCYNFFNTAWRESSAKIINDGNYEVVYSKIFNSIQKLVFSITIIVIAVMPFLYKILVNHNFFSGLYYIPILTVAVYYSSLSGYFGGVFTAFKDTKILGITSLIAAIINILINAFFITKLGLFVASASTFVSSLCLYFIRKRKVKKYLNINFGFNKEVLFFLLFLFITFLYYINNSFLTIFNIIFDIFISFGLCKKEMRIMYFSIKSKLLKN